MMNILVPIGKNTKLRTHYQERLEPLNLKISVLRYEDSFNEDSEALKKAYQECDGIILAGGEDVEPSTYANVNKHPTIKNTDLERERVEFAILKKAYNDKKPILGICRGAQMIAVHSNLQLNQHLPEIISSEIESHSKEEVPKTLQSLTANNVNILEGTDLRRIIGKPSMEVTCAHHQSVDYKENPFLKICAISKNGILEAFEGVDKNHFVIAVQFHPELGNEDNNLIFKAFRDACEEYKLRR